ncbi:rod shape-determining protein [Streptomyces sp. A3M-1-3]|uniref:rod shape-determining protein n=1 Tax=Streptomyces sp. A3M-1-3 TaxID=2962044 RepID=UPI0020B7E0B3|nr:rod shape-determining protein [Streptomyces sp. A3M-1-3]MCP3820666.1 rod shape-determining protein [Streptomyces sp. A3M-1-3]
MEDIRVSDPILAVRDRLQRCSVAVDLAADRTRVYLRNHGLVADEPSVVAVDQECGTVVAVGTKAEQMAGRSPAHIAVVRPILGGMVVDVELARSLLRHVVGPKLRRAWQRAPLTRAAVCLPYGSPPVACRSAVETLSGTGIRRVELVDTLLATAVGCGLPVERPEAAMVVVAGSDRTQVAVLSLGAVVASASAPVGSDVIAQSVVEHFRARYGLSVHSQAVRALLHQLSATAYEADPGIEVSGRDVSNGMPRSVTVDAEAARDATGAPLGAVMDSVFTVLRRCSPDLVVDIADRGIVIAGAVTRLPGLDALLRQAVTVPVHIADDPEECAVRGLGAMIDGRTVG